MTTRTISRMWLKASLLALLVGCGSNQVSIGEQNADASVGGASGRVDAPVSNGGASSISTLVPEGGAILSSGSLGVGGASTVAGNAGSTGIVLAGSKAGGTIVGGASALGGATLVGGKTGGNSGTASTGGSLVPRCGGYMGEKCPSDSFCDFGGCGSAISDAVGTCVVMPQGCTKEYVPVCGCDGTTYGNDCARRAAGVGKSSDGACKGTGGSGGTGGKTATGGTGGSAGGTSGSSSTGKRCASDTSCGTGEFCDFLIGNCGTTFTQDPAGTCVNNAGIGGCIALWQPVCGCNGKTYGNDCERRMAGMSKRSEGECPKDGGVSDAAANNAALCTATGGTIKTQTCCASTSDFPNSCLVGACGCDPATGHDISVCICPTGCFVPGEGCFACTLGSDQTCNNDPTLSSLSGKCQSNGRCSCNAGYVPVANGRCQADTP